ncbi:uncharacterized protein LOC119982677 isoform X1 [Tripterygium wilfordii]|uniref:uncharacterized protein LOC119982677 isoform X1 n=1 Tax=Tripterygium wilfordii TaxID=458696 RepID=UPI0018F7F524|nr:uncharacterized protein LOC119982677 isoform X1 [Tripterygium wilfordii]
MAAEKGSREAEEEYVYRISTAAEWEEFQKNGSIFGGELDKSSGFIHLSKLDQVQSTLQNFFLNTKVDLYLLQIDAKKLGDGLIYEIVDGSNSFPHFYGPSRSFSPLPLSAVTKAEKLSLSGDRFTCCFLI